MQLRQAHLVSLESIVHPALDALPQGLVHEERHHDHEKDESEQRAAGALHDAEGMLLPRVRLRFGRHFRTCAVKATAPASRLS